MKYDVVDKDMRVFEVDADEFNPGKDGSITFYTRGNAVAYFAEVHCATPAGALVHDPNEGGAVFEVPNEVLTPYLPKADAGLAYVQGTIDRLADPDPKGWMTIPLSAAHDMDACTELNCPMCNVKEEPNE